MPTRSRSRTYDGRRCGYNKGIHQNRMPLRMPRGNDVQGRERDPIRSPRQQSAFITGHAPKNGNSIIKSQARLLGPMRTWTTLVTFLIQPASLMNLVPIKPPRGCGIRLPHRVSEIGLRFLDASTSLPRSTHQTSQ